MNTFREADRDPVDVLAEEFADRLRRGEHPSVADYAARHPQFAEQLREVLPAVAQMEQLKRFRKATSVVESKPLPASLGDFRIVRELGRGGMGVVYEAIHESLGRRVALKVLPTRGPQSAKQKDRFLREAQAAAKLHHTNIVPVFGFGEQDGVPYYVMQLIRGRGLNAVVADWRLQSAASGKHTPGVAEQQTTRVAGGTSHRAKGPTKPVDVPKPASNAIPAHGDWEFVARVGVQAADALQAAHDQGVLHRDVKPGNLLFEDNGRVWVTDFGLAKMLDRDALTDTGDVLGTLPYMPPEAFHGPTDQRGDVYGLGATLYEMLTLETPFNSDTPAGLIRQIDSRDPYPPRKLNPAVPQDLETIVLKALARDPKQRYSSAGELADDLRAYLDDRPIRARRSSLLDRGRRWARRNPTVAVLSASTMAAILLATVLGWMGFARTRTALANEAAHRQQAEDTAAKLEANLNLSLEAFEKLFNAASQEGRGPGPGGFFTGETADIASILETVLAFYDKFAEQNATNPRLQFEAGKAHRRVGEVQAILGRTEKSVIGFRRAAGILETLARDFPDSEPTVHELMLTYAHAPMSLYGKSATAWKVEPLAQLWDDGRGVKGSLRGASLELGLRLGVLREQSGDLAAAERIYGTILRLRRPLDAESPLPPWPELRSTADATVRLAGIQMRTNRLGDAKRLLEGSVAELEQWGGERGPMQRLFQELLAEHFEKLAELLDRQGEADLATTFRQRAAAMMASRGKDGPFRRDGGRPPQDGMMPKGPFGRDGPPPDGPFSKGPKGPKGPFGREGMPPPEGGPRGGFPGERAPPPKGPRDE